MATQRPSVAAREEIAEFCRRKHIRRLSLFGSVLRPDFRPDSDIDVLVEFEPGHVPGLRFIQMQEELSRIFGGRQVDLVTPKFLNHRIRDQVLRSAEIQYAPFDLHGVPLALPKAPVPGLEGPAPDAEAPIRPDQAPAAMAAVPAPVAETLGRTTEAPVSMGEVPAGIAVSPVDS